jgi:hypothetical protein
MPGMAMRSAVQSRLSPIRFPWLTIGELLTWLLVGRQSPAPDSV